VFSSLEGKRVMSRLKLTPKVDLHDPIYHDDDAARAHLESVLWPQGPACPRGGVMGDRITKLQGQSTRPGVYKCKDCRRPFSVTVGTVMERSHIRLSTWVWSAQIMSSSKKGFSALELQRMIGTNYETAWFLFHRLREAAEALRGDDPLGGAGKIIEADEAYIGGKETNKHHSKRHGKRGAVGKTPVVVLVERKGKSRAFRMANVTAAKLQEALKKHVDAASVLMTDESNAYTTAGTRFAAHEKVDHSREEYAYRDRRSGLLVTTNGAESYIALFKRGIYGTFHNISEAHLDRYLAEFDFRANTRDLSDRERCAALLAATKGRRLVYENPDEAANI
jgi:transposase-like protein